MTLSTDQCIEVAEEIWEFVRHGSLPDTWVRPQDIGVPVKYLVNLQTWNSYTLKQEVLSWSGLGRTLEAMAEKGLYPELNTIQVFSVKTDLTFVSETGIGTGNYAEWNCYDIKTIIPAIHLAALEALEEDK